MRKILGVVFGFGSAAVFVAGAAVVKWYVWDIAIGQAGDSDRSMLFWGLPVAFLGVVLLGVSFGLAMAAKRLFGTGSPRRTAPGAIPSDH